jgi:hypothetical protein
VQVRVAAGAPVAVEGEPLAHVAGPWRLVGEWWSSAPFGRDYYDLETRSGALYRAYLDHDRGRWFIDGVYD